MLTLANIAGWIVAHLRLIGVVAACIAVLVLGLWVKSCISSRRAKLDEKQIQAAKQAVEEHNNEKLKEVLAEADAKQAVIDQTVANTEADTKKAEAEAKKKYDEMSPADLQAEAKRRVEESQ